MSSDSLDLFEMVTSCLSEGAAFICPMVCVCVCGFQVCGCCVILTCCWHDLDNSEYDCWPLDRPNEYNMMECGGENSENHHRVQDGEFKLLPQLLSFYGFL